MGLFEVRELQNGQGIEVIQVWTACAALMSAAFAASGFAMPYATPIATPASTAAVIRFLIQSAKAIAAEIKRLLLRSTLSISG